MGNCNGYVTKTYFRTYLAVVKLFPDHRMASE
jgi:hypothetical protein